MWSLRNVFYSNGKQIQKRLASSVKSLRNTSAFNSNVFGQPVAETHPHLINNGDLVPGITLKEFQERRTHLILAIEKYAADHLQKTSASKRSHLAIIPSSSKKYMSDKIPYVFRQNSDFYYFTGCLEPDTVLAISITDKGFIKSILFMRGKDKYAEMWEGHRTGVDLAIELFGVDEAYSIESFENVISRIANCDKPLVWFDMKFTDLAYIKDTVLKLVSNMNNETFLQSPTSIIHGMRLFKSVAEQNLMRRTCNIAATAINEVMCESKPGNSEHQIFAMIDYKCRMLNASHLAYPPVVASGKNATIIHYINNTQLCKHGDLVLMDAGCEYGGYSSDITRTWPIDKKFTNAQKVLYEIVLQLQKELIETLLKNGGETLDQLFETMCFKLGKYLQEIGLVPKNITDVVGLTKAGYQFCPHHVSHYLGLDVHDTPLIPRSLRLLPGMVCTVEPGIYISSDRTDVPEEFRGIGIRIEDDVLITNDHKIEVLTASCKKEIKELENVHQIKQT